MARHLEILSFWFGRLEETDEYLKDRAELWFGGSPKTDDVLRTLFLKDVEMAAAGLLHEWEENPLQCLALILLLDQFSLNIFRGQPRSFEVSALALPIALKAVQEERFDQRFHPLQRVFFYLPLEHSEDLAHQVESRARMQALAEKAAGAPLRTWLRHTEAWAEEHCKVIERFGRFPHRNEILGRASTPAEKNFLAAGWGNPA